MDDKVGKNTLKVIPDKADQFGQLREPTTGERTITNYPTQLLGNRAVTGTCVLQDAKGTKTTVKLLNWMPARTNPAYNGEDAGGLSPLAKGLSGSMMSKYQTGDVLDAVQESLHVMSYLALSIVTGHLPTPDRPSWENTTKAVILGEMVKVSGMTPIRIEFVGKGGVLVANADLISGVIATCTNWMEYVQKNWNVADRKRRKSVKIDYI
jgi:energy-converting hydrogenase Eha subunit A